MEDLGAELIELFARARPRSTQRGRSYLQMGRTSQLNQAEATPSRDVQELITEHFFQIP